MKDILVPLLSKITEDPDSFTISVDESEFSTVYTVLVKDEHYPLLIGKGGSTVKALTAICNYSARKNQGENFKRSYIHIRKQDE